MGLDYKSKENKKKKNCSHKKRTMPDIKQQKVFKVFESDLFNQIFETKQQCLFSQKILWSFESENWKIGKFLHK